VPGEGTDETTDATTDATTGATTGGATVTDSTDTPADTADAAVDTPARSPADAGTDKIRVETDPFDLDGALAAAAELRADLDAAVHAELLVTIEPPAEDPPPPAPPPWAAAAQDAAYWTTTYPHASSHASDPLTTVLLLRYLQMPVSKPVTVNLHLPMATALDVTDAPGILDGHGPLDARRIRELLPDAQLREVYVDAVHGVPLGSEATAEQRQPGQASIVALARRLRPITLVDAVEPQHDPSAKLAAFVKLRDQRCSGPGCTLSASRCHLDHEDEHPKGPTAEWNLGDKSARCHGAKHHGWTVTRQPDGTSDWASPTGRTYTSQSVWPRPPRITRTVQYVLPPVGCHLEIEMAD
jgi:hypothetical protein